jgi:hypothetical protein
MGGFLLKLRYSKKLDSKGGISMIQVIMGLKGSGKTKRLINSINEAVASAQGDVVCIEYGKQLTYDINYRVRLVDSKEYEINNLDKLKGLLSGLHAGNFDITNVYIDNLYKTIGTDRAVGEEFILWCAGFAEANKMNITITVSDDAAACSAAVKAFLV